LSASIDRPGRYRSSVLTLSHASVMLPIPLICLAETLAEGIRIEPIAFHHCTQNEAMFHCAAKAIWRVSGELNIGKNLHDRFKKRLSERVVAN